MNIEKLTKVDKKRIRDAHKIGKYDVVQKILTDNKIQGCGSCVNGYALREWCRYWMENKII